MRTDTRDTLLRQLETAWKLMSFHVRDLTTAECLWQPTPTGPHVRLHKGAWVADWPEREDYELGPPTIAWLTWHVGYWWSMVLDHSFGPASLRRELVVWSGDADAVRVWLNALHERWQSELLRLTDQELLATERTRWPFAQRPFADVAAWVNLELTKNAAEIGYARFLHASRTRETSA